MGRDLDRQRRRLLLSGLGLAALPLLGTAGTDGSPAESRGLLVSAFYLDRGASRRHWLVWGDPAGARGGRVEIPARGHGLCRHPGKPERVLLFARRPGDLLWEVDLGRGAITAQVACGAGHHFFGHGVFSPDGARLYTTEHRYADGTGLVRVRDGGDYRVLEELSSGGTGPHDIRLLADGRTLVVANGGIETHPDQRRRKLNLDRMDASLTYLDSATGAILEQHRLAHPRLSIRHLAVSASDEVVAIQQFEGDRDSLQPLVLFHRRGRAPRLPAADQANLERMNQYTASAAIDSATATALVTCPKGNLVTLWSLVEDRLIASYDLPQPYGAAPDPGTDAYLVTCATGQVYRVAPGRAPQGPLQSAEGAWDNHLLCIG